MRSLVCLTVLLALSCSTKPARSNAFKATSRTQLVGGKRALGEVGDYVLSNSVIHAVVQDVGFSRGFGAFGGSLIDLDMVRPGPVDPVNGPTFGNDYFTEMFPAFFLQASEPYKVEVAADGSDGGPAIIRVTGNSGDFLSIVKPINGTLVMGTGLTYTVDYVLEPGASYLKIICTMRNDAQSDATFPLVIPFGFIALLGEGQHLFVPGKSGYDIRFNLEDNVYPNFYSTLGVKPEALPGVVAPMWATEGSGVSYALAASPRNAGYMAANSAYYPGAKPDSMLIPVAYSSFLGSYWSRAPSSLAPGKSWTYTGYLAVGGGDVASAQRIIYGISDPMNRQPVETGELAGRATELATNLLLTGASVVIEDDGGNYVSQAKTDAKGMYTAPLPPGKYKISVVDPVRGVGQTDFVEVKKGETSRLDVTIARAGTLNVVVRDEGGRELPAKISVEGTYDLTNAGIDPPRKFLYSFASGERYRVSDMVPDTTDPLSRKYLERVMFAPHGAASTPIRPGHYTVWASRGNEYSVASAEVDVSAGKSAVVELPLKHVMPTPGWASGDFHVHSVNSVDSDMQLEDRVTSYAVEGVDIVTATDHNFVSDFSPVIDSLGLNDWIHSVVGLELTSLEMGHFNGYPIQVQPGPITHGSFRWFYRPPGELFAQLRGLGADPQKTIVQVNHPRDSILGYFNGFNFGSYDSQPHKPASAFALDQSPQPDGGISPYAASNFSYDFDALEVFNGKRDELLFTYRIPQTPLPGDAPTVPFCSAGQVADCIPDAGEVLSRTETLLDGGTSIQPVYPGALEDWYNLLAHGKHVTATGNSDSHNAIAEAGLPRTYLHIGDTANGSMRGLSEAAAMEAIRKGDVVVSNGPFPELTINGVGLGGEVVAPTGDIELSLKVSAPAWIDVQRVFVRRGGPDQVERPQLLETIAVPQTTEVLRLDVTKTYSGIPDGSFIVVEVQGDKSMWPVFTPYEIPSIQISDAVGVIGGAFGFGNKYGRYHPDHVNVVRPFAFTNPIWIDRTKKQSLSAARPVLPLSSNEPFHPRTIPDIRKIFANFHGDPE
ncbi:MAG: CehA/McbA family metallohydrolase [Myxococcaceae bacterium]